MILTRSQYKASLKPFNKGKIKPTDIERFIIPTLTEMVANVVLDDYMNERDIQHEWVTEECEQKSGVDIRLPVYGRMANVDFKIHCYNNDNFVYETRQADGGTWADKMGDTDYVGWVNLSQNKVYFISMKSIMECKHSNYPEISTKNTFGKFKILPLRLFDIVETWDIDLTSMSSYIKKGYV